MEKIGQTNLFNLSGIDPLANMMINQIFYMLILSGLVLTPPSDGARFQDPLPPVFGSVADKSFRASNPQVGRKASIVLPGGEKVEVSRADTPDARERGLIGNPRLNLNDGMLFLFETDELHFMWMKNMNFAIDMIWLNNQKEIIEIVRAVPPCQGDPCPVYGPRLPSRSVLELQEGAAVSFHLKKGMRLQF
jgi:uncharacterized membrane protein (UPF0127 family)